MIGKALRLTGVIFALGLPLLGQTANAGIYTWDAGTAAGAQDGGGVWDTTSNLWWDGAADQVWPSTAADTAVFGAGSGAAGTVTINGGVTAGALTFNTASSGNYTIAGDTLTLGGATPTITVAAGLSPTISSLIATSAGITKAGAGTLILTGANNYSYTTTISGGTLQIGDGSNATARAGTGTLAVGGNTLTLNLNGTASLGNSSVTSSGLIQNVGAGKVTLTNGAISGMVDGGTAGIVLSNYVTGDFGFKGDITFGSNASNRTITAAGPGATAHIVNSGTFWWFGTNTAAFAPNVDIASGVTVSLATGQGAGTIYYNNITGLGNFTYNGNATGYVLGTVSMSGTITAGNRDISFGNGGGGGTFAAATPIVNTAGVAFNSTTDTIYSGRMTGGGAVTKTATNTLTFTGTNAYTAATIINLGTLRLDFNAAGAPASNILYNGVTAGGLTLGGGAFSVNGRASGASAQTLGNLTVNAQSSIVITPGSGSGTTLTLGNTWTRNNNAALLIDLSAGTAATLTSNPAASLVNSVIPWAAVKDSSGFGFATIASGNVVRYTGAINPLPAAGAGAALNYSLTGSGAATASQTVTASQTANSLSIAPTAPGMALTLNSGQTLAFTGGAIAFDGTTAPYTIIGPGQLGASAATLTVLAYGPNALTIAAPISSGAGGLSVGGNGTVVFTSAASYTGTTTINPGATLQVGSGTNDGSLTTSTSIVANGTLAFNLVNGQSYGTVLSGNGSLTKTGAGALTLGNEPSYTGAVVVNGGIVYVNGTNSGTSAGLYNARSVTINSGGTLYSSGADNGLGLGGATAVTVNAGGTLMTNGSTTETIGGTLTLAGGTLGSTAASGNGITYGVWNFNGPIVAGGVATTSVISAQDVRSNYGSITVNPGAANGVDLDVTGIFYSTPGLTKAGSGVMRMSGANTYSGPTTISGGALNLDIAQNGTTSGPMGSTGTITFSGGALQYSAANQYDYSGRFSAAAGQAYKVDTNGQNVTWASALTSAGGSLIKGGLGTLTISASGNSYSAGTMINAGTLFVSGASLPAGGAVTIASGGNLNLADGTTRTTSVGGLTLNNGAAVALDWSGGSADLLATAATATATGQVTLLPTGAFTSGTAYTLLQAAGGLGGASYVVGNTNYTATISVSSTGVVVTPTSAAALTSAYWLGGSLAGGESLMAVSNGTVANWAAAADGAAQGLVPGSATDIYFSANGGPGSYASPVLGADMTVRTLTFSATSGAVTIGGNNMLTISPTSSATGITANENATINANLGLGAAQTWTAASGKTLTVGGRVSGTSALTTAGAGTVLLTGANAGTLGNGTVTNNGTLAFNFASATTISNALAGNGTFANAGSSVVTLSQTIGSGATVNGGTAGIVCGTSVPNTYGLNVQGLVTVNGNCPNSVIAATAPGATFVVTTGLATWWTGTTTLANAPNYVISTGATVSQNTGQGAGYMYFNNLSGGGNFAYYNTAANGTGYILGNVSLTGTITAGKDISFGNGGAGGTFSGGPTSIANNAGVKFNSTTDTTYSGVMSGAGAVTKTASNTLTLTGASTYTGATTINQGTVVFTTIGNEAGGASALGNPSAGNGTISLGNGSTATTLRFIGSASSNSNRAINLNGDGVLDASGAGGAAWNLTNGTAAVIAHGNNVFLDGSGAGTLTGPISGAYSIIKNGTGTWTLAAAHTASNGTQINRGTLVIGGAAGSVNGPITNNAALVFNRADNPVFSNPISGSGSVAQTAGVLTLSGTNTYTGPTNVGGTLILSGTHSGGDAYSVATAATLGGGGTISGTNIVTLSSGANLAAGNNVTSGAVGTLTLPNLSVAGGGTAWFDLSSSGDTTIGSGVNDLVAVTGSLALAGITGVSLSPFGGAAFANGTYTLFAYGTLSGTNALAVVPGQLSSRQLPIFDYGTGTASAVTLTIQGNPHYLTWVGTGGGTASVWDSDVPAHTVWTSTASVSDYFAFHDLVTFDASAGTNTTVTLSGTLAPTSVLVTGTNNYTFTGSGYLHGATGVTLAGPGTLTIANSGNDYTGGTWIQSGKIVLGVSNGLPPAGTLTLGTTSTGATLDLGGCNQQVGSLAVGAGAAAANQVIGNAVASTTSTFTVTGTGTSNFDGAIQDGIGGSGGAVALSVGSGMLVLGGSNTYTGATAVNGGTLQLGSATALYGGAAAGSVAVNGVLDLHGQSAGIAALSGAGTVTSSATGAMTLTVGNDDATSTFSGMLKNDAGTLALIKTGSGALTLAGANNYGGATTINGGTLQIGAGGAASLASPSIANGGTLIFSHSDTLTYAGTISGSGALIHQGGGTLNLNGTNSAFSGNTVIALGTVAPGNNLAFGTGTIMLSGGTLGGNVSLANNITAVAGTSSVISCGVTFSGNLAGSGTINKTNVTSPLTLTGSNSGFSGTYVAGGWRTFLTSSNAGSPNAVWQINTTLGAGAGSLFSGTIQLGALTGNGALGGGYQNNGGLVTYEIGGANLDTTFGGVIANKETSSGDAGAGGTVSITKTGSGTLALTNTNSYTGGTTINGGILALQYNQGYTLAASSTITINAGGTLRLDRTNPLGFNTAVPAININGGTLTAAGSSFTVSHINNVTMNGGTWTTDSTVSVYNNENYSFYGSLTVGGTAASLVNPKYAISLVGGSYSPHTFLVNATGSAGPDLTVACPLQDESGSGGLLKTSNGVLCLAGTNTYTGATTINAGTLQVDGVLAAGSAVSVGTSGTLTGSGTIGGSVTLDGSGVINLSGGTIGGGLAVTGGYWKGAGMVAGPVTSSTGTFYVQNTLAAPLGVSVTGGAITDVGNIVGNLSVSNGATVDMGGTISGSASATGVTWGYGTVTGKVVSGSGMFLLRDSESVLTAGGGLDVTGGSLAAGNAGSTIAASVNYASPEPSTYQGRITGTASSLTVSNTAAVLTLSGSNNYGGGTTVNAGTLNVAAADSLPAGGGLTIANGGHVVLASGLSHAISLGGLTITSGAGGDVGQASPLVQNPSQAGSLTYESASPTPEPGAIALLAAAAVAGLAACRSRRRP